MSRNIILSLAALTVAVLVAILSWLIQGGIARASDWPKQFGSPYDDTACTMLVDAVGNVYVVGATEGSLFSTNAGGSDVYVVKYDADGVQTWASQVGTDKDDTPAEAVLGSDGHLYVAGTTRGDLYGTNPGGDEMYADVFVVKLSPLDGSILWSNQFGTPQDEVASGIALDDQNNVYVLGLTHGSLFGANSSPNAFVAKFVSGNLDWGIYVDVEMARDVQVGSGCIYVSGATTQDRFSQNLGGFDAYLAKIGTDGTILWGSQFGTLGDDYATVVSVDAAGGVYVAGSMNGTEVAGADKAFLARYDSLGQQEWLTHLNTDRTTDEEQYSGLERATAIAFDSSLNILVAGSTGGELFQSHAGGADLFVAKYDQTGDLIWGRQFGTARDEFAADIALSTAGEILVLGNTSGGLYGSSAGGTDVFIAILP